MAAQNKTPEEIIKSLQDELEEAMMKMERLEATNTTLKDDLKTARDNLRSASKVCCSFGRERAITKR